MNLDGAKPQKSKDLEVPCATQGEAPGAERTAEAASATHGTERPGASGWMEAVVERRNLRAALKRVKQNKGSAGIDGMTVEELSDHLRTNWPMLREQLLAGTYQPAPVRRRTIPKSSGGERELGIPTVLDRFIQQALLQVLQPRFDPTFSEHSHGFRPKRSAHDAVREAQRYVQQGKQWVVDVDLEKFFDRVNHDMLMGRLAKRIEDRRVLGLIRRYLNAGIMADGVVMERHEGTPQGGPLTPLTQAQTFAGEPVWIGPPSERASPMGAGGRDDRARRASSRRFLDMVGQLCMGREPCGGAYRCG